jgi:hypothetical protein
MWCSCENQIPSHSITLLAVGVSSSDNYRMNGDPAAE